MTVFFKRKHKYKFSIFINSPYLISIPYHFVQIMHISCAHVLLLNCFYCILQSNVISTATSSTVPVLSELRSVLPVGVAPVPVGAVIEAMLRYSFISFLRELSGTGTRFTAMTKFIRPQKTRRPQKSLWIM